MQYYNLLHWIDSLNDAGVLVNILCVDEAQMENAKVIGYDKDSRAFYVEDEEGDKLVIFMDHIISLTPVASDADVSIQG